MSSLFPLYPQCLFQCPTHKGDWSIFANRRQERKQLGRQEGSLCPQEAYYIVREQQGNKQCLSTVVGLKCRRVHRTAAHHGKNTYICLGKSEDALHGEGDPWTDVKNN